MIRILTIVGARPQFIKAAVVSREMRTRADISEILVHTGQHFDANMSDIFFEELDIQKPDYNLGIGGGTHGQNTGRMIEAIETVLLQHRPDWVLVYGDTDSTLAGALSAVKLHVPIAHVEAGLRSFNRRMPEEINRILTDHASDLLLTPTDLASRNLTAEGIGSERVKQVGDVMFDAALYYGHKAETQSHIMDTLKLSPKGYVLATVHRQENTDNIERLSAILAGFGETAIPVIWPLHPRTRKRISEFGLQLPSSVRCIDPVGYLDMVMLEKNAALIATDSGGVQKEAYFHRVPCITLRDETEWIETVEMGWNQVVGTDEIQIQMAIRQRSAPLSHAAAPYGNGDASQQILNSIKSH
jgi:UDP-GlcNAc3NAcA epimerase